jgi:hypothetical protein
MHKFHIKKLNEVEGKEQYQVQMSNRFTALENSYNDMDINRAWEIIWENIKISGKESLGMVLSVRPVPRCYKQDS